jgi:MYXO-CTERM domain-containing protein
MTTQKPVLFAAALVLFALSSGSARADVPMPECVNNPACDQGGGCSLSATPADASLGTAALALVAAGTLLMRRRRAV